MTERDDSHVIDPESPATEDRLDRRTLVAGAAAIGAFAGLSASQADASNPPEKINLGKECHRNGGKAIPA